MKINNLNTILFLLSLIMFFPSCTEDDDPEIVLPIEFLADNNWVEDELSAGDVLWFRAKCDVGATTMYLEWAEKDHHGESRTYTGDIKVSAYMLDKSSVYIENKDNGFGESAKSFGLSGNETEVLIKVEVSDAQIGGTFALRAKSTSTITVEYLDFKIEDAWRDSTITMDDIIGFKVKYSGTKKLKIIWAEIETPEAGYTADIMVSVLHADGVTPYKDVDKNKDFLDKNKSHSDDAKFIITDSNDKNIKIHIKNTVPGSFALKVVEVSE